MNELFNYVGIILLLISILYTGRQVNIYLRMKRHIGKRLTPLTPGSKGIRLVSITGIAFLVLFILVATQYISYGYELNASFSIVLAVVIFSSGRFLFKMSELREEGIMGNLEAISYNLIKTYKTEDTGGRTLIKFSLRDNREFVAAIEAKDKLKVLDTLSQRI